MFQLLTDELVSAFQADSRDIDLAFAEIHAQFGVLEEAMSDVNENPQGRVQAVVDIGVVSIGRGASGAVTLHYTTPDGMHGHAEILHFIRCPLLTTCFAENVMRLSTIISKALWLLSVVQNRKRAQTFKFKSTKLPLVRAYGTIRTMPLP